VGDADGGEAVGVVIDLDIVEDVRAFLFQDWYSSDPNGLGLTMPPLDARPRIVLRGNPPASEAAQKAP
jgi:hypothetical protein